MVHCYLHVLFLLFHEVVIEVICFKTVLRGYGSCVFNKVIFRHFLLLSVELSTPHVGMEAWSSTGLWKYSCSETSRADPTYCPLFLLLGERGN